MKNNWIIIICIIVVILIIFIATGGSGKTIDGFETASPLYNYQSVDEINWPACSYQYGAAFSMIWLPANVVISTISVGGTYKLNPSNAFIFTVDGVNNNDEVYFSKDGISKTFLGKVEDIITPLYTSGVDANAWLLPPPATVMDDGKMAGPAACYYVVSASGSTSSITYTISQGSPTSSFQHVGSSCFPNFTWSTPNISTELQVDVSG